LLLYHYQFIIIASRHINLVARSLVTTPYTYSVCEKAVA